MQNVAFYNNAQLSYFAQMNKWVPNKAVLHTYISKFKKKLESAFS